MQPESVSISMGGFVETAVIQNSGFHIACMRTLILAIAGLFSVEGGVWGRLKLRSMPMEAGGRRMDLA